MTADPMVDRLPPQNADAERGVLGAILRDPDILPAVQGIIRADSFYHDAHRKVFQAVADLAAENRPVDLVLLHERLRQRRELEDVGGPPYLARLWEAVPTGASAEYHAKIVRDCATARGVIHAANEILRDAYDRVCPADELVAVAERKFFDLTGPDGDGDAPAGAAELVREAMGSIDDRAARGGALDGIGTGYADLDDYLSGLRPGQVVVIGARPSCGKTALGTCIALNAVAAGVPSLLVSVEMSRAEIMTRVLSVRSGVPMRCLQRGDLNDGQAGRVNAAGEELSRQPFHLSCPESMTATRFGAVLRRAVRRRGVRLAVLDYLQLLDPENRRQNRTEQVGLMARLVKLAARGCGVPTVLLAQLNRDVEGRGGRPRLSDLRDSGEIEQHADIVLLLHPQAQQDGRATGLIDVIVAKNRNGAKGEVTLSFTGPLTRFDNAVK